MSEYGDRKIHTRNIENSRIEEGGIWGLRGLKVSLIGTYVVEFVKQTVSFGVFKLSMHQGSPWWTQSIQTVHSFQKRSLASQWCSVLPTALRSRSRSREDYLNYESVPNGQKTGFLTRDLWKRVDKLSRQKTKMWWQICACDRQIHIHCYPKLKTDQKLSVFHVLPVHHQV